MMPLMHIVYVEDRWRALGEKRRAALEVVRGLAKDGLSSHCYGSVARGDAREGSDVDVVIPAPVPSYRVELALDSAGFRAFRRQIVQATPGSVPKAYIYLDPEELAVVSFPLARMTRREEEFYRFGGMVNLEELERGARVPGVNRSLRLIVPADDGHLEDGIEGKEQEVARLLGIHVDTVEERVYMLSRRKELGRTGVFIKYELGAEEEFEDALRRLSESAWHLRKQLEIRGR